MTHAADIERIARQHSVSPADVLEEFLKRASIREYQGGQSRQAAEVGAVQDCVGHFASRPSSAILARVASAVGADAQSPAQTENVRHRANGELVEGV